jgi:hypothetical protein
MSRRAALSLVVLAVVAIPALALAATSHHRSRRRITVAPGSGYAQTRFVVRFRAPERTGRFGSVIHGYEVAVWNVFTHPGCQSAADEYPAPSRKGATITVVLGGGTWCVGRYNGNVDLLEGSPGSDFQVVLRLVGKLSFEVRSSIPDTTPPVFGGLRSAFYCARGRLRPDEIRRFTFTWRAAADDVSPSAQMVYDLFASSRPGGENFKTPNETTPPGVTTYKNPELASHHFYLVVRARDEANNEDHNRVERRVVDRCH